MLHWETAPETRRCPHCGSDKTAVTFTFLALVHYSCEACGKSFNRKAERSHATSTKGSAEA
jgi:transposase-like protein